MKHSWGPAGKCLLLCICCFLCAPGFAYGNGSKGRDIALKADGVDTSSSATMSSVMLITRGSQQLSRQMSIRKKRYPDAERQLIRFFEPSDIRNTAYLTWTYKDIQKGDDMWVYMPAEALVRRLSGGGKKGAFMRSDYAMEDISKREVDEDTYTYLHDEKINGIECHVIEATPVFPDKSNYHKRRIWIRKDIFLPAQIDYYNKNNKFVKQLVFGGFKQIQGIWTSTRQRMRSADNSSETIMEMREVAYNKDMADDIFQQQDLKR